jgi:hypothetical protein
MMRGNRGIFRMAVAATTAGMIALVGAVPPTRAAPVDLPLPHSGLPGELPLPPLPEVLGDTPLPVPPTTALPPIGAAPSGGAATGAGPSPSAPGLAPRGAGSPTGGQITTSGSGSAEPGGDESGSTSGESSAAGRRERRIRATVRRLLGCLGVIDGLGRRVLALRAGIGAGRPATRAEVADRLETSRGRVRAVERRALRQLRTAGTNGTCRSGSGSLAATGTNAYPTYWAFVATSLGDPSGGLAAGRPDPERGNRGTLGASASSDDPRDETASLTPPTGDEGSDDNAGGGPGTLVWVLALLALVALGGAFLIVTRQRAQKRPKALWLSESPDEPPPTKRR